MNDSLAVLDFITAKCVIYTGKHFINDEAEDFLETQGYSLNNIQWMVTSEAVVINPKESNE